MGNARRVVKGLPKGKLYMKSREDRIQPLDLITAVASSYYKVEGTEHRVAAGMAGSNLSSPPWLLCRAGQVTSSFCASVFQSVKWVL